MVGWFIVMHASGATRSEPVEREDIAHAIAVKLAEEQPDAGPVWVVRIVEEHEHE